MKIQCNVCNKEDASVFCSADEAALCDRCDRCVHHANKLAEKHTRFSLIHPSFGDSPRCDICQERRAFTFCKEDRAILCKECDFQIHNSNEHTQNHSRFFLTGIKLSASSSVYPTSSSTASASAAPSAASESSNGCCNTDSEIKPSKLLTKKPISVNNEIFNPHSNDDHRRHRIGQSSSVSTSSTISEYLETLPGWHVEEFLDPSPDSYVLCKFMEQDDDSNTSSLSSKSIWVPQFSPLSSPQRPMFLTRNGLMNGINEVKEANSMKVSRKFVSDCLAVPQFSPPLVKKSRHL